jgi:molecular chaperone GrpE (heat shock protein)
MNTELLQIINQVFDLEKKALKMPEGNRLSRNFNRIKSHFANMGIEYLDPLGEAFNDTRTDVVATITGTKTNRLVITEVIKPIIIQKKDGLQQILQQGIFIVEQV